MDVLRAQLKRILFVPILLPWPSAEAGQNRRWRKERKAGRGGKRLIVEAQAQLEWFNWFQSYCLSA